MDPENEPEGTTVTVHTPDPEPEPNGELVEIRTRIEGLDERIADITERGDQWQQTTITPLQQEVADLRATLKTVTEGNATERAELKAELTRLSQEVTRLSQTPLPVIPVMEEPEIEILEELPPLAPSDPQDPEEGHRAQGRTSVKPKVRRVV